MISATPHTRSWLAPSLAPLLVLTAWLAPAHGQLPATQLGAIYPSGANPNQKIEATIYGVDLDDVDRLLFSHAGITAKQKLGEQGPFDKQPPILADQFEITVAANVPIGIYEVRAVGKYGASNPRFFSVGDTPEAVEAEPNNSADVGTEIKLPVTVNGQSNQAGDVDFFRFEAQANQRLLISSIARRGDSPMDTVVTVYDPQGRVMGSSGDDHNGDSLISFTTAAAGPYLVKVHDSTYLGSSQHTYRLLIGALPHIDFVFPPAGVAGDGRPFTIYGVNLPGGKPSSLRIGNRILEEANVTVALPGGAAAQQLTYAARLEPASGGLDAIGYRVKGPQGSSQPVLVGIATAPVVVEAASNDTPATAQALKVPCEVAARFFPARDRDWYELELTKDEQVTVEVISQRMGLPTNPSLLIQRVVKAADGDQPEQLQQLAYLYEQTDVSGGAEFDIRHQDPVYQLTAAATGRYRFMVHDVNTDVSADPRRNYRLSVTKGLGDFRLVAVPEQSFSGVLLRKGGQAGIRVVAFRRSGFDGDIKVTATGLPAGVTCTDAIIGPSNNVGMLVLTAAPNAAPANAAIQVTGTATINGAAVSRPARFGSALAPTTNRTTPNQRLNSVDARLAGNLVVSVSAGEATVASLQAGGGKVWETSRGGKLTIPVARGGTFKGQINFMGRGLPGITFPLANLGANKPTGEIQLTLPAAVPPGAHSFYLEAIAAQADYARNPEAAAKAAERKKEVDAIKVKADADAKAAATAKAAADKAATDANTALTTATTAKAAADQTLTAAKAAVTTAMAAMKTATAQAQAAPEDAARKTAVVAAQKQLADAEAKVKTATATATGAAKQMTDAMAQLKTATDAKQKADAEAEAATKLAQTAAQLKTQTDQQATTLANAAKPKKVNVPLVSTPITIQVAPAPVTVPDIKPVQVKQGAKVEAPFTIARLFSFDGPVTFNVTMPPGVGGLSVPNASVPAKQTASKFLITAAANATEGAHDIKVRGSMSLNGQTITIEQTLRLTVQKGDAK